MSPRIVATIEARMTSTRLPGKVLRPAVGKPYLELMVERLKRVPSLDGIVIATTTNATDDPVVELAERLGVGWYRGSEEDVLTRVLEAAKAHAVDVIVETTGDCPVIDPDIVEQCIASYRAGGADYVSNFLVRDYPIGMETQVFATDVLADVARRTDDPSDHEHVSLFIYRHPELYRLRDVVAPPELTDPDLRLTLDTPEDDRLLSLLFERLYPRHPAFTLADILGLIRDEPALRAINGHVQRKPL
ncbi:cytidylyltransferase domain-containing protein [Azospirillum soli]|uniref:cytidylyltransferase domain-containing protein n=1 Tax=Azospirillum soli TaxID=1304799 RepID=UPI001AE5D137|nr:glycosyltransferase family protein [Azospirillum soli]MBP2316829.1 spore coat polysaccharide biosynthesis protein SpsF [Azospirillum soli]